MYQYHWFFHSDIWVKITLLLCHLPLIVSLRNFVQPRQRLHLNEFKFQIFIKPEWAAIATFNWNKHTCLPPNVLLTIQAEAVNFNLCWCIFIYCWQGPDGVPGEDGLAGPRVSITISLELMASVSGLKYMYVSRTSDQLTLFFAQSAGPGKLHYKGPQCMLSAILTDMSRNAG